MGDVIDTLELKITSDADDTSDSLDRLIKKMDGLSRSVTGLGRINLGNVSHTFGEMKKQFSSLGTEATSGMERLRKTINSVQKMAQIDFGKIDTTKLTTAVSIIEKLGTMPAKNVGAMSSIARLVNANYDGIHPEKLDSLMASVSKFTDMPDVSQSVNRYVSSMARLANAGDKTGASALSMRNLGKGLKSTAKSMRNVGEISPSVNQFTASIAKLAGAGEKTNVTAMNLELLSDRLKKFMESMQNAPRVNEHILRTTEAVAKLAEAGSRLNKMSFPSFNSGRIRAVGYETQNLFKGLSNIGTKASNVMKTAASKITATFRSIGLSSKHIARANLNLGTFLKGALALRGIRGFYDFSRSAIDLGSDITEVENVVDTAFGNMKDKAYDFAGTATEKFGLSELVAKSYAGTMMSILKASKVTNKSASEMAITLSGLAGDLASFYNVDSDVAFEKLKSGITGQVQPLRAFGINLSQANLQEYALSQGISKSVSEMSQAEKTMLRYNYILASTKDQRGDFVKTNHSWANEVRQLTLNYRSLLAIIGQGLISAVLPGIQALNALMSKLKQVAERFRDFMYVLTGKKPEGSQKGVITEDYSTGLEDLGDAGIDASKGLDKTAKSAKKLNKWLAGFDELEVMNVTNDTGLADFGNELSELDSSPLTDLAAEAENTTDTVTDVLSEFAEQIRNAFLGKDWERLGSILAKKVNKGLKKLYDILSWKKVGPKITSFTDGFTRTFNSFVKKIRSDDFGKLLGTGINTIVNTINQLIGPYGIDFSNIGIKLSDSLRNAVREIEWRNVGTMLGNKFMILWNTLTGFVNDMNLKINGYTGWQEIGDSIANTLNGALERISFPKISHVLASIINGASQSLAQFNATFKWDDLVTNVTNGINTFINDFEWEENGKALNDFITKMLDALVGISSGVEWETLGRDIGEALSKIDWTTHIGKIIDVIKPMLGGLWKGLGDTSAGKFIEGFLALKVGKKLLPLSNDLVKFFTGKTIGQKMTEGFKGLFNKSIADGAAKKTGGVFKTLLSSSGVKFGGAIAGISYAGVKLAELFDGIRGGNAKLSELGGIMDSIGNGFAPELSDEIFKLKESLEDSKATTDEFKTKFIELFTQAGVSAEALQTEFDKVGGSINVTAEQHEVLQGIIDGVAISTEKLGTAAEEAQNKNEIAYRTIKEGLVSLQTADDPIIPSTDHMNALTDALDRAKSSGADAKGMFDAVATEMGNLSLNSGPLEELLAITIPEALRAAETSASTASNGITTAVDGMISMEQQVATSADNIIKGTGTVKRETDKNFTESQKSVSTALSTIDIDTKTKMQNVMTTIQFYWSSVLINTNQIWEKMSSKVGKELANMLNSTGRYVDDTSKELSSLHSIGYNAIIGMNNGMVEASNKLFDNLRKMARGIPAVFKNVLQIHSPSVVMDGIAGNTMDGLINRFVKSAPRLEGVVGNLALGIESRFGAMVPAIQDNMRGMQINMQTDTRMIAPKPPQQATSNAYSDEIRREILSISSNVFNNNQNIGRAVSEALNGMAVYADGEIIGYLQKEDREFRRSNGHGLFEMWY